jgi:lipopolysaccharide transport system ATP-binding protein
MAKPVISVEALGKRYTLSHQKRQDTLRDSLVHGLRGLFTRFRGDTRGETEDFWALRDVSFEINKGDVVGIIGRNGAGKSTLLKILSRITEPTSGRAVIRGRVASLLEVGTGFHPELSGRENIFLNGAILGMSRMEIARKFDEIVAFAEIERFLDTPVKHYSSGMYVRLAFAVAAHLEPEILIVDEVLAVGDAQFQNKCLGKINQVTREDGRTVLIVSHNMDSILRLCRSALVLAQGRLVFNGPPADAVARYAESHGARSRTIDCRGVKRPGWIRGGLLVEQLTYPDPDAPAWSVRFGQTLEFECALRLQQPLQSWHVFVALFSTTGVEVAAWCSPIFAVTAGETALRLKCASPDFRLTPGSYLLNFGVQSGTQMQDMLTEVTRIEVLPTIDSATEKADAFRGFYVPRTVFEVI